MSKKKNVETPVLPTPPVPGPEVGRELAPATLTIDNLVYQIDQLPRGVQEMLGVITDWKANQLAAQNKLNEAQLQVNMWNYALTGLQNDLVNAVRRSGVAPIRDTSAK